MKRRGELPPGIAVCVMSLAFATPRGQAEVAHSSAVAQAIPRFRGKLVRGRRGPDDAFAPSGAADAVRWRRFDHRPQHARSGLDGARPDCLDAGWSRESVARAT